MADPTTRLQSLAEISLDQTPLSPSEVRRRGDRLRRRRTGAAVLASAACVAAVAVGVSVVNGPARTAPIPPSDQPTPSLTPEQPLEPTPTPRGGVEVPDDGGPGNPEATPTPREPNGRDIPASYPLAAGMPERHEPGADFGLTGPNRKLEPLEFTACGTTLYDGPAQDRLRVDWHNVEWYIGRQLTTYADADAAVAAVNDLVALYRDCPRQEVEDGFRVHHSVTRTAIGGESWAIAKYATYQGNPAIGLTVTHVIRLGRAVLVVSESTEGGAGPDREGDISRSVDEMTSDAAEPLAAMCAYTEVGC